MFLGLAMCVRKTEQKGIVFRADRVTQITQYMYLNRQKCEKRYMIFMKISNKVLPEMVFFHSRI